MSAPALAGRHAIVTGAARGIGVAIAHALASAGAHVSLLGRDLDTLTAAAAKIATTRPGSEAAPFVADVADSAAVGRAITSARARFGPVHLLVNNAGQAHNPWRIPTTPSCSKC